MSAPSLDDDALRDTADEFDFFFQDLTDSEFLTLRSGPRLSSSHRDSAGYFAPVTLRNYITGHYKKVLRQGINLKGDFSYLVAVFNRLPLELQLTVLEHLHPLDLYHLSLSSKAFRSLVLNSKAKGAWKTSFERHPNVFPPAVGVSASDWAFMLFGPGICEVCGLHGALTDFAFRRRFCERCLMSKTILKVAALNLATDAELVEQACSLLPRTSRNTGLRHSSLYSDFSNARYIHEDMHAMAKKILLMEILKDNGVPSVGRIWEEWKAMRLVYIGMVNTSAEAANHWAMDLCRVCASEIETTLRWNASKCRTKLEHLGHDAQDVSYCQYSIAHFIRSDKVYKINPRAFRKLKPKIEPPIIKRKCERIKDERMKLLEDIYVDYQKTLPPDSWQYMPPRSLIKDIPAFSEFMNAPLDVRGDLYPGKVVTHFPAFIAQWVMTLQQAVVATLPDVAGPATKEISTEEHFLSKLRRLNLCTSTFSCADCNMRLHDGWVLVGWSQICRHACFRPSRKNIPCVEITFNERLSASARLLVLCAGLDPDETTWQDMDALDARFFCGNCRPIARGGVIGLQALTWRECLMHMIYMEGHPVHDTPSWLRLTSDVTRFVKEHEYDSPTRTQRAWRCNHCPENFSGPTTQDDVVLHLAQVHRICSWQKGVDLAVENRWPIQRRKPFCLGTDPAYQYRCMKCPTDMGIYKLWCKPALMIHLSTVHKVPQPETLDDPTLWTSIDMIAASTGPQLPPSLSTVNMVNVNMISSGPTPANPT